MCRFLYYEGMPIILADLLVNPKNSLIRQSFKSEEREEPLNGDGFGVAWYQPKLRNKPGIFRSISPAWSNANLNSLAQVTESSCVLAHVRAASDGLNVSESNCHPFTHEQLSFMHNGSIAAYAKCRRELLGLLSDEAFALVQGTTDSEVLFCLFVDAYRRAASIKVISERMAHALTEVLTTVLSITTPNADGEYAYFNVLVSDGKHAVAARVTTHEPRFAESLHLHTGQIYRLIAGELRMEAATGRHGALIISSERLSDDPGWTSVPPNHLVVVHTDRRYDVRPYTQGEGVQQAVATNKVP